MEVFGLMKINIIYFAFGFFEDAVVGFEFAWGFTIAIALAFDDDVLFDNDDDVDACLATVAEVVLDAVVVPAAAAFFLLWYMSIKLFVEFFTSSCVLASSTNFNFDLHKDYFWPQSMLI